jgi:hypothetical protein
MSLTQVRPTFTIIQCHAICAENSSFWKRCAQGVQRMSGLCGEVCAGHV